MRRVGSDLGLSAEHKSANKKENLLLWLKKCDVHELFTQVFHNHYTYGGESYLNTSLPSH